MLIQFVTCILILSTGRFHVAGPMLPVSGSFSGVRHVPVWLVCLFVLFFSVVQKSGTAMRVTVTCWRVLTDLTQSPLSTSARRALHCKPVS